MAKSKKHARGPERKTVPEVDVRARVVMRVYFFGTSLERSRFDIDVLRDALNNGSCEFDSTCPVPERFWGDVDSSENPYDYTVVQSAAGLEVWVKPTEVR